MSVRILILSDLFDHMHFNRLNDQPIKQLYVVVYLLQRIYPGSVVSVNDRSAISYKSLWIPSSQVPDVVEMDCLITRMDLNEIDYSGFDFVICHPSVEGFLSDALTSLAPGDNRSSKQPRLVTTSKHELAMPGFDSLQSLFSDSNGDSYINDEIKAGVKALRQQMEVQFAGLDKDHCEDNYIELVRKIVHSNFVLRGRSIKQILVLDDHQRKFYLGDACFWFLYNIKRTIHKISNDAHCTINCCNPNVYPKLAEMFQGSFGENTAFANDSWDRIDFQAYDLILVHPDSILKLLYYLRRGGSKLLTKVAIYFFDHMMETHAVNDRFGWNYKIISEFIALQHKPSVRVNPANNPHKEIRITDRERKWADEWFWNNGLANDENVIILIDNASTENKVLPPEQFKRLMLWLLTKAKTKVLIFDERSIGKRRQIEAEYGSFLASKIIVAEALGLRNDMCLLSASCVRMILGPCTGLLHLSNNIYTYLINHGLINRADVPLMIVYTGSVNSINSDYHPKDWWLGSMVKCAVIYRGTNGEKVLKRLGQCSYSKPEYFKYALPVADITAEMLIEFIMQNAIPTRKAKIHWN